MKPGLRRTAVVSALAVAVPWAAMAGSAKNDSRFVVVSERSLKPLMVCPAHAYGTPDEAFLKAKQLLAAHPAQERSSVWVCRADQANTLERFAPLAADMYFSSAMTALASSDYSEAARLLEIVQYRYPESRLQGRVSQIQLRLQKAIDTDSKEKGHVR